MGNEFKVKNGLIINSTQVITGITNSSDFSSGDTYTLATINAITGYLGNKRVNSYVSYNSGGTLSGSSSLTFDGNTLTISGDTKNAYGLYSYNGAMCIKMTNKTGGTTTKGKLVTYYPASPYYPNAFKYYPSGTSMTDAHIGVTVETGIADGGSTYVALYGVCDVKLASNSDKVCVNTPLSTNVSLNDGDIGIGSSAKCIGHALQEGVAGDTIKCLLYNKDTQ